MHMSVKARYVWIGPMVLVASWLAVRSLAAFPAEEIDDPQPSLATPSSVIADPALSALIARFAFQAREQN